MCSSDLKDMRKRNADQMETDEESDQWKKARMEIDEEQVKEDEEKEEKNNKTKQGNAGLPGQPGGTQ